MIKEAISNLIDGKKLTRDEAYAALTDIMSGDASDAQIGAFLTALRIQGETPEVITGAAQAMREKFSAVKSPSEITTVTVRAHDLVDGWGGQEITVDLTQASGSGFEVVR